MNIEQLANPASSISAAFALLCIGIALSPKILHEFGRVAPRTPLAFLSVLAATCSAFYIAYYLGGDARVIDATSYRLQAKTFATGHLALHPNGPLHSFSGRFLVSTPDDGLAVIFPPGYAGALALFTSINHPLWLGPIIAAGLVLATYKLALSWFASPPLALTAALASALCGVLRYHTADTMSHGLCALLLTLCLLALSKHSLALAGLACGALFLCRPLSGVAVALSVGLIELTRSGSRRGLSARSLSLFMAPMSVAVALYVGYQATVTGQFFTSAQHLYYSLADGPVGCFRLGFAEASGCRYEHGDFLKRYMPEGYGLFAALATSARRLSLHVSDALNAWWVWVLAIALAGFKARRPAFSGTDRRFLATLLLVAVPYMSAYGAFYFDGNYPGGGARMFAELLPLEHVLFAWILAQAQAQRWAAPLLLLGFSLSGSVNHLKLKHRDGGRPMHDAALLATLPDEPAILFTNTDHAFNLAFPAHDNRALTVARLKEDRFDFGLWQHLDSPKAYKYLFNPVGQGRAKLVSYTPKDTPKFEAESAWPLLNATGGWAVPVSRDCASRGRALALNPTEAGKPFSLTFNLWATEGGTLQLAAVSDEPLELALATQALRPARSGSRPLSQGPSRCEGTLRRQLGAPIYLPRGEHKVRVSVRERATLDYLELLVMASGKADRSSRPPVAIPKAPSSDRQR